MFIISSIASVFSNISNKIWNNKKHLHSSDFIPKEVFVIVDGISTGRHIAPLLRGYGYSVVHVLSDMAQGLHIQNNESDYIENIKYNGNIQSLVQTLGKYKIRAIIPGAEAGVDLADMLNHHLNMPL